MLTARLRAVDDLRVEEMPTPVPAPGEVLVEVGANTICGTDLRIVRGAKTAHVRLPVVLGHEAAGRVAEVGAGVVGYRPGDRVALLPAIPCRRCWACQQAMENLCVDPGRRILGYSVDGGMAEFMLVPADAVAAGCLFVARSDLPYEQLALAEPLGAVVGGQRHTPVHLRDTVLVMGAGPIGLLHLQLALLQGASAVVVSQRSASRRALAERLGAVAVDPASEDLAKVVHEVTGGRGVDVTFICIGVPTLVDEAMQLTRIGGRVDIFAGMAGAGRAEISANLLHNRQLTLTGSSDIRRIDYAAALELIESGRIDTASMVTHRFRLAEVGAALQAASDGSAVKVAVMPQLGISIPPG
jgi:L-iditol 2-dehydrogenase